MKKTTQNSRAKKTTTGKGINKTNVVKIKKISPAVVAKQIANFNFIAAELKNIKIPVLTPLVAEDVPGSPAEPIYSPKEQDDIQGNIIPGFNKDHQHFLFYRIGKPTLCKKFLKWLVPYLSSMEEVLAFRRLFRAAMFKLGRKEIFLCSTWVNIAFSHRGIALLTNREEAGNFGDQAFRQGLAARSTYLGDPSKPGQRGHAGRWKVGGTKNEADIIIIVASDSPGKLDDMVDLIKVRAVAGNMKLLFEQRGETLPGDLRGHEHFGFRDGISQPGIRGKLSSMPGDYITPRYIANTDDRRLFFAKPGQLLAWPGQFLLGELRQSTEHLYNSAPAASNFPGWAARGSYLVVRRLNQDVRTFWQFAANSAALAGINSTKFASILVGRWPSGAPVMRVPGADNTALGEDSFANNHFIFDDNTRPSNLRPIAGYPGDSFPPAMADFLATVCPHFAHIRKVNPRDGATDLGKPEDNLARMILRRGIPFGPPLIGVKRPAKTLFNKERGLMFLNYGGSIEDQFEFLQRRWSNSSVQPNFGGFDPIIGQNGSSTGRIRFIDFPKPGGGTVRIKFRKEWVIPSGGGYFFAPTISAVRDVLGA
jgi:Dyp-type peroxidase family